MANGYFERGEVYWVNLGTGYANEKGAGRPGVIVSLDEANNASPCVTVALMTTKNHGKWWEVSTDVTGRESQIMCNEISTYDKARLGKFYGTLTAAEMRTVEDTLEKVFGLGYVDEEALTEKDIEIEARNAVITEKDAEIQSLKDRMKNQESANADEVASLKIEVAMWQRLYDKALNQVVDMKFTNDLFVRGHLGRKDPEVPPVAVAEVAVETVPAETTQEESTPEEENRKVDINACTMTALKKLGFSLPMAKKITEARPFSSVEDLKRVNGLKASLYRVVEPKLCCNPVEVTEAEVVEAVETPVVEETPVEKEPDPGFELVDINTAAGKDLVAIGFTTSPAYAITSYRKRNGPFGSIDDLRKVPISQKMIDKFRMYLTCVVPESEEAEEPEVVDEKLNVNEATVTELMNVGFTKAAANRIVAHRRKNGPFREVHDLMKIPDVTGKTLRKLGDRVRV